MDKMLLQTSLNLQGVTMDTTAVVSTPATSSGDWRQQLPVLAGAHVTLREVEVEDAPALMALLTTDEVSRFVSTPPTTVEGFARFISWARREREQGRYLCYAVVPHGMTAAVGIIQVKKLDSGFATAEWGFALGSPFWGSGFFAEAATLVVDFAVETLGVHRLEGRVVATNGRGNGALRKLGAVQEGVLRRAFQKDGLYCDQALWSILAEEWREANSARRAAHVH